MKISRKELDEFERTEKEKTKPLNQKILDFLSQNIDYGIELVDIMKALQPGYVTSSGSKLDTFLVIAGVLLYNNELYKLEEQGKIRSVRYKNKTLYYAIEQR